jgi:hypothetical protein
MKNQSAKDFEAYLNKNGFEKIGSGMHAHVYSHPKRKDIAVKVSRDSHDTWPEYVAWATENGFAGTYAPKVYSLKSFGKYYVAVMERLVDTFGGIRNEYGEHIKSNQYRTDYYKNPFAKIDMWELMRGSDPQYPDLANYLKNMASAGFSGDLHDGNIMVRHDGSIVVTDPSSHYSDNKLRIRRGQVIRP